MVYRKFWAFFIPALALLLPQRRMDAASIDNARPEPSMANAASTGIKKFFLKKYENNGQIYKFLIHSSHRSHSSHSSHRSHTSHTSSSYGESNGSDFTPVPKLPVSPRTDQEPSPAVISAFGVVLENANVRSGPGAGYSIAGLVLAGQEVYIAEINSDWIHVSFVKNEKPFEGWIFSKYVRVK
jgi:hypothetical protein